MSLDCSAWQREDDWQIDPKTEKGSYQEKSKSPENPFYDRLGRNNGNRKLRLPQDPRKQRDGEDDYDYQKRLEAEKNEVTEIPVPPAYDHLTTTGWSGALELYERNKSFEEYPTGMFIHYAHELKQLRSLQRIVEKEVRNVIKYHSEPDSRIGDTLMRSRGYNGQLNVAVDYHSEWGEVERNFGMKWISNHRGVGWSTDNGSWSNRDGGNPLIEGNAIHFHRLEHQNDLDRDHTLRAGGFELIGENLTVELPIRRTKKPKPEDIITAIMLEQGEKGRMYGRPDHYAENVWRNIGINRKFTSPLDFATVWTKHIMGQAMMRGADYAFPPHSCISFLKGSAHRVGNQVPKTHFEKREHQVNEKGQKVINDLQEMYGHDLPTEIIEFLITCDIDVPNIELQRMIGQMPLWLNQGLNIDRLKELYKHVYMRGFNNTKGSSNEALKAVFEIVNNIFGNPALRPWWFKENFSIVNIFNLHEKEVKVENGKFKIGMCEEGLTLVQFISHVAGPHFKDVARLYKKAGFRLKYECGLSEKRAIELTDTIAKWYAIEHLPRGIKIMEHLVSMLQQCKNGEREKAIKLFFDHIERHKPSDPVIGKMQGDATFELKGINQLISAARGEMMADNKEDAADHENLQARHLTEVRDLVTKPIAERAALVSPIFESGKRHKKRMLIASEDAYDMPMLPGALISRKALPPVKRHNDIASQTQECNPLFDILQFYEHVKESCEGRLDENVINCYFNLFSHKMPNPLKPIKGLLAAIYSISNIREAVSLQIRHPFESRREPEDLSSDTKRILALLGFIDGWLLGIYSYEKIEKLLETLAKQRHGYEEERKVVSSAHTERNAAWEKNENRDESRLLEELAERIQAPFEAKNGLHDRKKIVFTVAMRKLHSFMLFSHKLLRAGLLKVETINKLCNEQLDLLLEQSEIFDERVRGFTYEEADDYKYSSTGSEEEILKGAREKGIFKGLFEQLDRFTQTVDIDVDELTTLIEIGFINVDELNRHVLEAPDDESLIKILSTLFQGIQSYKFALKLIEGLEERFESITHDLLERATHGSEVFQTIEKDVIKFVENVEKDVFGLIKLNSPFLNYDLLALNSEDVKRHINFVLKILSLCKYYIHIGKQIIPKGLYDRRKNSAAENVMHSGERTLNLLAIMLSSRMMEEHVDQLQLPPGDIVEAGPEVGDESVDLTEAQFKNAINSAIQIAQSKGKEQLIEVRRKYLGYLPVGGKIHVIHEVNEFRFQLLKKLLGLDSTPFRLMHAGKSVILPAAPNPEEMKTLLSALQEYQLINEDKPELQVGGPGRLSNKRCGELAVSVLLATDQQTEYDEKSFTTTHNDQTQSRIIMYDAGAPNDKFPFASRKYKGRTDMLGRRSIEDINNFQLLQTILVHEQYGGPFEEFGDWFTKKLTKILKKHDLKWILDGPWVHDNYKSELNPSQLEKQAKKHYKMVKACTDAWFAHHDEIMASDNGEECGGIIYDVRDLLEELREKINEKQELIYDDISSCEDASVTLSL